MLAFPLQSPVGIRLAEFEVALQYTFGTIDEFAGLELIRKGGLLGLQEHPLALLLLQFGK